MILGRFIKIIHQLIEKVKMDNVGAFAAQTAFFVMLSAIPFAIFFVSLIQFLPINEYEVITMLEDALPSNVENILLPIVREIYNNSVEILSVATITAIWSSAKAIQYLSAGLNAIYDLEETRNYFWLRIRSIGYMLAFSMGIIFLIVVLLLGKVVGGYLAEEFPILFYIIEIVLSIKYIILFVFLFLLFISILRFLPNHKTTFRKQFMPALVAAAAWVILSYGLNLYVNLFHGFSMYGSMTTVILLLLWLYFGIYILFLIAELEAKFSCR